MNLAFSYRRTSTEKQGHSLDVQESQCDGYCKRMGFVEVGAFADPDARRNPNIQSDRQRQRAIHRPTIK